MPDRSPLARAVSNQDPKALANALRTHRGAIPPRLVGQAAGLGWTAGLKLLEKHGADLNGSYKNYRPLHALIQEKPHVGGSSTPKRVACLEWLLEHGADPELTGAWPAARALVIAAFVGEPTYVSTLIRGGARIDIFTASSLGDSKAAATFLKKDASLATARDQGILTALQCCAGSRLGKSNAKKAAGLLDCARQLVSAGADVNARTRSWGHDVAVSYFVIGSGQVATLEHLLAHGLDPTAAITTAAWESREDILDLLVRRGGRIDEAFDHTKPVLNELVRWGQFKQARMLLSRGASPNVADERGWTAVHQGASRGNVKMLADLMAAGGDATRRDHEGFRPADIARFKLRGDLLPLLEARR